MVHVTIKSKTNNWINEQEVVVIHSQEWLNYTKSKKRLQNEYGILRILYYYPMSLLWNSFIKIRLGLITCCLFMYVGKHTPEKHKPVNISSRVKNILHILLWIYKILFNKMYKIRVPIISTIVKGYGCNKFLCRKMFYSWISSPFFDERIESLSYTNRMYPGPYLEFLSTAFASNGITFENLSKDKLCCHLWPSNF